MDRPAITADQREMAVVMLANALRKDAHLRNRQPRPGEEEDVLRAGLTRRRAEASQRYVDGMRDMLRVLFPNGDQLVRECMEDAYARVMGITSGDSGDGMTLH
jgi:hypothetical protein